ncbi:MAG: GHMP kinase, partial [Chloroflexi bacterium]|nr:GHMP kinase [Chloroflexota bacterium]
MLIARAPVRLSFAGGGTDIPPYFRKYGGMVVSTTIDKYFYVFLGLNGQGSIQISSSDYRTIYRHRRGESLLTDGALNLPRAVLHEFGIDRGLSLFLASEVPPGTGLGSSSAVAVALIKSLSTLCERPRTKQEVAELACQIEIERLHQPVGYQDQFASAFGGFNVIEFSANETTVCPLAIAAH